MTIRTAPAAIRTWEGKISVRRFGAKGDGVTDDTRAVQAAYTYATSVATTTRGRTVYFPEGRYRMTAPITYDWARYVDTEGDGPDQSILYWPQDMDRGGAGDVYAFGPDPTRITPAANSGAWRIKRIAFEGLSIGATIGVAPVRNHGVRACRRHKFEDVHFSGFWAGCAMLGDHHSFLRCKWNSNYVNLRRAPQSHYIGQVSGDDHVFWDCDMSGSTRASVSVAPDTSISGFCFSGGCHFGYGPFGFWREPDAAPSSSAWVLQGEFIDCSWEACGNAHFYDESKRGSMVDVRFSDSCSWVTSLSYIDVAQYKEAYTFYMQAMQRVVFERAPLVPGAGVSNGIGLFDCAMSDITFYKADNLVGGPTSGRRIINITGNTVVNVKVHLNNKSGSLRSAIAGAVTRAGQLLAADPASNMRVRIMPRAGGIPVGYAVYDYTVPVGNDYIMVVDEFDSINALTAAGTPIIAAARYLKPDPANDGCVVEAAYTDITTSPLVGYSVTASAAGPSTVAARGRIAP